MASFDPHRAAGPLTSRAVRWNPPPMPVVLRVPRIVPEAESQPEIHRRSAVPFHRSDFRWPVGVGVGVLMLVAAIPWLIRWRPSTNAPLEVSAPAVTMEAGSDIEILPPLYAQTTIPSTFDSNSELGNEGGSEWLEGLTAPHPTGGSQ
jgi:hypothetical protein